ncbi:nuclear transport factor 2 family protein [Sphingobium sp. EM0848]|uniref:nuclear transport factor 2 family protein n=1 Tax=Sphingobium sp. EM0848 TaxID=2743473 RepID=UPI00159C6449|nr:nuclear transport factor 2 family protein [Sphingobium sp. EM0848]
MDIGEALIREEIRYTIGRYISAVDRSAYHELSDIFMPDGVMHFGGMPPLKGRDTIIAAMTAGAERRKAQQPGNFSRHVLGQSIINVVSDTTARSIHYIMVISEIGLDHSGLYIDDFVKSGDRWLIAHRSGNLEWAHPNSRYAAPSNPSNPQPGPTPRPDLNLGFMV